MGGSEVLLPISYVYSLGWMTNYSITIYGIGIPIVHKVLLAHGRWVRMEAFNSCNFIFRENGVNGDAVEVG